MPPLSEMFRKALLTVAAAFHALGCSARFATDLAVAQAVGLHLPMFAAVYTGLANLNRITKAA